MHLRPANYPVRLTEQIWFPPLDDRVPDAVSADLVAVGGDLSPGRLKLAYRSGIFPWSVNPITWWSPRMRGIIDWGSFRVSRSLRRVLRRRPFQLTADRAFQAVMTGCAEQRREATWVSPEFVAAYTRLHESGEAHSLECWQGGELVGGIYGVAVGGVFAGESMFHRVDDASKVALVALVRELERRGYAFLDVQMVTPLTARFGAVEMERREFLERLEAALPRQCGFPRGELAAPME